ncbi:MAG: type VI secretion system baseplate subunit TssK [Acidobacteria bacterium]|nr:type VI secretion system baseplate subunit TssK [Acidobacteriota bacterium]MCG3195283.1 hypothetical protein [Thermoanaerobaculia bacterium]MCK6683756.1 type VI secretion system baseplate subunit TssK [Thermoanaerobaculia bacterium]
MKKTPQVFWGEGMFLRPHHLQSAERFREESLAREIQRIQPFSYGLASLDIASDQLENFIFEIRDVSVKLRDGTPLSMDSTLRIFPRSFKKEIDQAGGRMRVFVGVPVMRETAPNVFAPGEGPGGQDRRYVVESVEVLDENTGSNPQPVSIRRCNGRLFFGAESREGYECLEIAVVERSGVGRNFPMLAKDFIPSVTEIGASKTLQVLCDSVTNRVEAKHRLLMSEAVQGRVNLMTGGGGLQTVIKLQILGSYLFLFQQLTRIPRIHPFSVYTEFCRLAGELSVFDDGKKPIKIPTYDHDNLGSCFQEVCRVIEELLEKIVATRYVKIDFALREEMLVADLLPEHFAPDNEYFVAVETNVDVEEIGRRFDTETVKMGSVRDMPAFRQGRLKGLPFELQKVSPAGLPAREDYVYFKLAKDRTNWPEVVEERKLAICLMTEDQPMGPRPADSRVQRTGSSPFLMDYDAGRRDLSPPGERKPGERAPLTLREVLEGKFRFSLYIVSKPGS